MKENYACTVDLLERTSLLEKANNIIRANGKAADVKIWSSLLAACKVHGNEELGEVASKHLFKIDPANTGNYVLLASIYAATSKCDYAEGVAKMIRVKGGCENLRDVAGFRVLV